MWRRALRCEGEGGEAAHGLPNGVCGEEEEKEEEEKEGLGECVGGGALVGTVKGVSGI